MPTTRRRFLGAVAASPALLAIADGPGRRLGIGISSYAIRSRHEQEFSDPFRFLLFCRDRGAGGVQVPIGVLDDAGADRLRSLAADAGMILEGSTRPPDPDDPGDLDRFAAEIESAAKAGADVIRSVLMSGRRYETFHSTAEFRRYRDRSLRSLRLAGPVLDRTGVRLAVENHKDFRADEFLPLLDEAGVDAVGTCVDLGNNLALLEDPSRTVADLAPLALTCHLKDMAVEESADGFLLSEVPLGRGLLDLPALVATLRRSNPGVRFQLEMITRDPLRIPCLTDDYWSTLAHVPGPDLARTLATVRAHRDLAPLPRVADLPIDDRLAVEEANVRASLEYASGSLGL